MKRLLMFILTLSALCATAQEIQIKGDVSSVLTREGVSRAVVRLMTMDGETVLATDLTTHHRERRPLEQHFCRQTQRCDVFACRASQRGLYARG